MKKIYVDIVSLFSKIKCKTISMQQILTAKYIIHNQISNYINKVCITLFMRIYEDFIFIKQDQSNEIKIA
jgi:hypothetical protein